jgi:hypothetical protein
MAHLLVLQISKIRLRFIIAKDMRKKLEENFRFKLSYLTYFAIQVVTQKK